MVQGFERCFSVHYHDCHYSLVVLHFSPSLLFGKPSCLPKRPPETSWNGQPHSETNSHTKVVHEPDFKRSDGWYSSVRSGLHRTLFHHVLHLAPPLLLLIRIPLFGILILVITCAEISVVMCYFQLCSEDWHWWWRSYMTSATSAFYMFLYAIFYYMTRLDLDGFVPSLLYFGYSLILCFYFFVMTGTIGYYSCYYLVRKMYQGIHSE